MTHGVFKLKPRAKALHFTLKRCKGGIFEVKAGKKAKRAIAVAEARRELKYSDED